MALNVGTLYAALKLENGGFDKQIQTSGNMMKSTIAGAAGAAAAAGVAAFAAIAAGAGVALKTGIDFNAQLETQRTAWNTLTGSVQGANKMVQDLGKFAAKTPFSQMGLDSMAKYLYNADFRGQDLFGTLTKFGDIGGAFGLAEGSITELVRQFGQMKNAGVAYTEDLNIFEERGIPIMKELAKAHNVTTADIKKMAGEGKISYDMIQSAVDNMAGKTKGAMQAQSQTFTGLMSTMKDNAGMLAAELSKPMFDKMKQGLQFIIENMDRIKPVIESVKAAFSAFASAAMNFLTPIATQVKTFLQSFTGASGAASAFDGIKAAAQTMVPIFNMVFPFIKAIVQDAVSFVGSLLAQLSAFWQANGTQIIAATRIVWGLISTVIRAALTILLPLVQSIWGNIKGVIQGAMNIILGIIKTVSALITGDWRGAWEGVKQIISGAVQFIWNAVQLWFVGRLVAGIKGAVLGIRTFITSGFNGARTAAVSAITNLRASVANIFAGIRSTVVSVQTSIRSAISVSWNAIRSVASSAISGIRSAASSGFNAIRSVVASVMSAIRSVISTGFSAARNVAATAVNGIRSVVSSVFSGLRSVVSSSMSAVTGAIRSGWNSAVSFLRGINLVSVGKNIVQGLINGIGSMMSAVSDKISEVASSITGGIKKRMGIKSPSRVTKKLGGHISEGLAVGISKSGKLATEASRKVADKVKQELSRKQAEMQKQRQTELKRAYSFQTALDRINDGFVKKTKATAAKLKDTERKLTAEYVKERTARAKELATANDLFDFVEVKYYDPRYFVDSLRSQKEAIEIYSKSIENLKKRGVTGALLEELQGKGVGSAFEIQALSELSDYQLRVYRKMYNDRQALANQQTSRELADERAALNKQIANERKKASAVVLAYRTEWTKQINELRKKTVVQFGGVTSAMRNGGRDAMRGMIAGMNSMKGGVASAARSLAQSVARTIKNELKIKSPSRLLRDEVGVMIPAGIASGIQRAASMATNSARNLSQMVADEASNYDISGINADGSKYGTIGTSNNGTNGGATYNHTTVINSPRELNAREVAKLDRRASRNMALEMGLI